MISARLIVDRAHATLVNEQIGKTQHPTPEGYLLCEGVRVARTGPMMYAPFELKDLDAGDRPMIVVDREADVLFDADAINSLAGKSITLRHPSDMVNPKSWQEDTVGVALNPRRGEGAEHDYLICDLLITVQEAIDAVKAGLREVSCGYDCEFEQVKPGIARQIKNTFNHVALVERGRAGSACAIGDSLMKIRDALLAAFRAKDEEAFLTALKSIKDEDPKKDEKDDKEEEKEDKEEDKVKDALLVDHAVRLTALDARVAKLEKAIDEFPPKKDGDKDEDKDEEEDDKKEKTKDEFAPKDEDEEEDDKKDKKKDEEEVEDKRSKDCLAKDSAAAMLEWRSAVSKAEILAPGGKAAVFDSYAKDTAKAICLVRRSALKRAYADSKRKVFVTKALGDSAAMIDKLSPGEVKIGFEGAVSIARDFANKSAAPIADGKPAISGGMTPAKLQAINEAYRAKMA